MGVYIGLDIIPNYINQEEWERVFEETFELIQSYPFATLVVEQVGNFKRLVLERAKEQRFYIYGKAECHWKVNGDLESKKTGEGFTLGSSIEKYSRLNEKILEEDILYLMNSSMRGAREVFYAKTQGLPYHIPLLAIAALIESRFPKYACAYGDITKEQAQKAVNWANTILKNPIHLPVLVDPPRLLERLKVIHEDEMRIQAFVDLAISNQEEVDDLIAKNFSPDVIRGYFLKELKGYDSPNQLGAELLLIRYLNAGLPLDQLVDICCIENVGPRFDPNDFVRGICSTWVIVEPEKREVMNMLNKSPESPDTVESQFGTILLDMGFMGRKTKRYIPKDEVLKVLKQMFHDSNQIEGIMEAKYRDIVKMLEEMGKELKEKEEFQTEPEQNIIYTFEDLMFWDKTKVISDGIVEILVAMKNDVKNVFSQKDSQLMQLIGQLEKCELIKLLSKLIQEHHNLVLTRDAWNWIEREKEDDLMKMVIMLAALENRSEVTKLYRALLENRSLFNTYMK